MAEGKRRGGTKKPAGSGGSGAKKRGDARAGKASRAKKVSRSTKAPRGGKSRSGAPTKAATGSAQAQERRRRRLRRQRMQNVRSGVRQALQALYLISAIGGVLLVLSVAFVLYQWKEVAIVEATKQIEVLREEVRALESARSRREGLVNNTLLQETRLVNYGRERLGLERTIEQPTVFAVDKDTWMYYVRKDAAAAGDRPEPSSGD